MKRIISVVLVLVFALTVYSAFAYEELAKGSKGEEVKKIQTRLIELGFLTGSADGSFGSKTEEAVERFQGVAFNNVTGIVDEDTYEDLFSDEKYEPRNYKQLDYEKVCRNPKDYVNEYYKFTGRVLQVIEKGNAPRSNMLIYGFRIATKGNYDNVVYVEQQRHPDWPRILEGDKGTIYASFTGIDTYTTVIGAEVSLPCFDMAERTLMLK